MAVATMPLVIPGLPMGKGTHVGDISPITIEARREAQYESEVLTRARRDSEAAQIADIYLPGQWTNYSVLLTFILLVFVLAVRPQGLFGRTT